MSPQTTLRDFSAALDLLLPPSVTTDTALPVEDGMATTPAEPEKISTEEAAEATESEQTSPEEAAEITESEPQIVLLETPSDIMQRAWQRLVSSAAFRPELYLSWEQPDEEPFPVIRLHDQAVLVEDDPLVDLRLAEESNGADETPTFTDTLSAENGFADITEERDEEGDGAAPVLPEPIRYYRFDGTARLRKTRFLHLDLDVEYREPLFDGGEQESPHPKAILQDGEEPQPTAFLVHTLQQSRQVQTQEMEYFDGPVLAVLTMISRVEVVTEQATGINQTDE